MSRFHVYPPTRAKGAGRSADPGVRDAGAHDVGGQITDGPTSGGPTSGDPASPDQNLGVELEILPGLTLAQTLYAAGAFRGRALCSGAGRCGLCQVRFTRLAPPPLAQERERLAPERLEAGWRLACLRPPVPGSVVRTPLAAERSPRPLPEPCPEPGPGPGSGPGSDSGPGSGPDPGPGAVLGVDLGTTSVHWRFLHEGTTLGGAFPNPQLGAGSEVMSRLALARHPQGAKRLRQGVVQAVRGVVEGLPCAPGQICLAGNTCMTYLALGLDASGLAAAPYRVDWPGAELASLDADLPRVYIPPLPAPFVGGDVTAGLAAVHFGQDTPQPPWLLADLGTNGEFALVLPGDEILLASVPMGPALEGVGMTHGMLAGPGAAVGFALSPAGLVPRLYGGEARAATGISGTGYISLAATLLGAGALEPRGTFASPVGASPGSAGPGTASPLAARVLAGLDPGEAGRAPRLTVAPGLALHAEDVEALLKVKAAFCAAVRVLLDAAGLRFSALRGLLLAGALGEHVAPRDLEALGFLPPGGAGLVRAVGNSSLDGACLAAGREDVRRWLARLPERCRLVDVVNAQGFQHIYIDAMRFTHAG